MWLRHWTLAFDPFRPAAVPFVATPGHEEAVARLVHLVECGERRAELRGEGGIGKSAVLVEAARRLRTPRRRVVLVRSPVNGAALLRDLLVGIGRPIAGEAASDRGLLRLLDATTLLRALGIGLVIAVDDDGLLDDRADRRVLDRLEAIGGAGVSLLVAGRGGRDRAGCWGLSVRLERLSRSEAADYLDAKLGAAGRTSPTFSGRAVLRLHAIAGGLPSAIDRLAGLALRASALEGRGIIESEVVEGVAAECEAGGRGLLVPR